MVLEFEKAGGGKYTATSDRKYGLFSFKSNSGALPQGLKGKFSGKRAAIQAWQNFLNHGEHKVNPKQEDYKPRNDMVD